MTNQQIIIRLLKDSTGKNWADVTHIIKAIDPPPKDLKQLISIRNSEIPDDLELQIRYHQEWMNWYTPHQLVNYKCHIFPIIDWYFAVEGSEYFYNPITELKKKIKL